MRSCKAFCNVRSNLRQVGIVEADDGPGALGGLERRPVLRDRALLQKVWGPSQARRCVADPFTPNFVETLT